MRCKNTLSGVDIALVFCAFVAIITDKLVAGNAGVAIAGVPVGARISVLAWVGCSLVFAAFARFAIVVGAHVVVIAVDCATSDARTGNALIRCGA